MACCNGCNDNTGNSFFSYPLGQSNPCSSDCGTTIDTACVQYTGPDLTCIDIESNIDLQTILVAMDTAICAGGGGFDAGWDMSCLLNASDLPIENFQQFVESVSLAVCTATTDLGTFIDTTYADDQTAIQTSIDGLTNPETTASSYAGITGSEDIFDTLDLLSQGIQSLADNSDVSVADWNQCFIFSPLPTTVIEAFDAVIDMICAVKGAIPESVTLPTFDNVGTCLPDPTEADSLVVTVTNIRDILCTKPDFDGSLLDVGCLDITTTDLQTTVQTALDELNLVATEAIRAVDGTYFSLEYINPLDPCEGQVITFTASLAADRYVAIDDSDVTPGTLFDKIVGGDNVSLDFGVLSAGQVTISADNDKVGADAADTTPGFLIDKINVEGDLAGIITFSTTYNPGTEQVDIVPSLNLDALATAILSIYGSTQNSAFCATVCDCSCTTETDRTLSGEISATGDDWSAEVTFSQLSPAVDWFDASMTILDGNTVTTGSYSVTSSDTSLTGSVRVENTDLAEFTLTITVEDGLGNTVPGSTSVATNLAAAGGTYLNAGFIYGNSPTNVYILKIQIATPAP